VFFFFFFIKGHSPDFITFITKSQSSTTPDQTKHRHNHPTEFKDASLPKHTPPPPPPFEQSTKGQPKKGGEGQQPANKVTSQTQRPHRQAPGTTTNSFHKPYRTNTKTPTPFFFSFSSNHQQAKDVIQVFQAGLGGGGARRLSEFEKGKLPLEKLRSGFFFGKGPITSSQISTA
jgi:hypothetical protein